MFLRCRESRRAHAAALCILLALSGCKREERNFRTEPSSLEMVKSRPEVTVQPGQHGSSARVTNWYEENAYAMSEGKQLYQFFNCVGCHAHGGGGIGPAFMDPVRIYGSEPAQIYSSIRYGRPNGMPAFGGRIPEAQIWEIAAYVRSMSGLASADAAPGRSDEMKGKSPENSVDEQPQPSAEKSSEHP
jgi:cytochrome c oxidase cbb3-type subunit III